MQTIHTDIFILGAGPGGATAALFLAKENIPCVLADKAIFPRDKICGDALSGKVVEIFNRYDEKFIERLSLDPIQLNCWGVEFVAPNLESLKVPFKINHAEHNAIRKQAPGFIAKRIDFDNFLIDEVKKQKYIRLYEGCDIDKVERASTGFILYSKNKEIVFHAKLVIAANGAHSDFAKEIGGIEVERKHYCAGIRAYYKNVSGMKEGNYIELHFLKDFLPGYFWIFPLPNGEVNIGLGMRSDYVSKKKIDLKKKLTEVIEKYPQLKERFKDAEPTDKIRGYGLPLGSKKRKLSGDNYMLV
ncbi:MAG: FAD-dependent monooxygenase, partial [Fimbriimonadaceae bacterium]|nr:FAD-dependent monooxygenase [Chitinophagales bacterium]